jgi:predicted nucleic acid-binding protein
VTLRAYGERILPLTVTIARRWGRLAAQIANRDLDLAIAATALEHGLTRATCRILRAPAPQPSIRLRRNNTPGLRPAH